MPSPLDEAEIMDEVELIKKFMEKLSFREREILKCLFGLNKDKTEYTLEETARIYKVTRARIIQVRNRALRKLSQAAKDKKRRLALLEQET